MGRDRDEKGEPIPGARIQATYNLIDCGLAFRKGITADPEFLRISNEIRKRFETL
jgi:polar amino acid transport system ATP-binding protein/sulfate transport system ATP-binding protein